MIVAGPFGTFQYGEPYFPIAHSSAGALAVNVSVAPVSQITLTANITSLSFTGFPAAGRTGTHTIVFVQGGAGGFTVGWDAAVLWPGGSAPTITATAGAIDVLTFLTLDVGTSVYGFVSGQDFS